MVDFLYIFIFGRNVGVFCEAEEVGELIEIEILEWEIER